MAPPPTVITTAISNVPQPLHHGMQYPPHYGSGGAGGAGAGLIGVGHATASRMVTPSASSSPEDDAAVHGQWQHMTRTLYHYERLEQIGEGTYGQVYRAVCKDTGRQVALKKMRLHHGGYWGMPLQLVREIKILKRLQHPNLLQMLEVVTSKGVEYLDQDDDPPLPPPQNQHQHQQDLSSGLPGGQNNAKDGGGGYKQQGDRVSDAREAYKGNLFLVLEYVSHDLTGLLDVGHVFDERATKTIMLQLFRAVAYMHENKYVHRDIKSSNILIDSRHRLKLADFGLARCLEPPILDQMVDRASSLELTNKVITLWYRPPEILLGSTNYTTVVDVWSVGCILAELCLNRPLFSGKTEMEQLSLIADVLGTPSSDDTITYLSGLRRVRAGEMALPSQRKSKLEKYSSKMKPDVIGLLQKTLEWDPRKRVTASNALSHRYFRTQPHAAEDPSALPPIEGPHFHEFQTKKKRKEAKAVAEKAKEELLAGGASEEDARGEFDRVYRGLMKKVALEGLGTSVSGISGKSQRGAAVAVPMPPPPPPSQRAQSNPYAGLQAPTVAAAIPYTGPTGSAPIPIEAPSTDERRYPMPGSATDQQQPHSRPARDGRDRGDSDRRENREPRSPSPPAGDDEKHRRQNKHGHRRRSEREKDDDGEEERKRRSSSRRSGRDDEDRKRRSSPVASERDSSRHRHRRSSREEDRSADDHRKSKRRDRDREHDHDRDRSERRRSKKSRRDRDDHNDEKRRSSSPDRGRERGHRPDDRSSYHRHQRDPQALESSDRAQPEEGRQRDGRSEDRSRVRPAVESPLRDERSPQEPRHSADDRPRDQVGGGIDPRQRDWSDDGHGHRGEDRGRSSNLEWLPPSAQQQQQQSREPPRHDPSIHHRGEFEDRSRPSGGPPPLPRDRYEGRESRSLPQRDYDDRMDRGAVPMPQQQPPPQRGFDDRRGGGRDHQRPRSRSPPSQRGDRGWVPPPPVPSDYEDRRGRGSRDWDRRRGDDRYGGGAPHPPPESYRRGPGDPYSGPSRSNWSSRGDDGPRGDRDRPSNRDRDVRR